MKGIYTGRFQPFSLKHLGIVSKILKEYPALVLTIGVADWRGELTQTNFLRGEEAVNIARLALIDSGLGHVEVIPITITPEVSLEEILRKHLKEISFELFFSGSDKTLAVLGKIADSGVPVTIIDLQDDDQSPPRSSEVRRGIKTGGNEWQTMVSPGVFEVLCNPVYRDRLNSLESGEKRPWRGEANGNPFQRR